MRPHKMTADRGLQPDQTVELYVKRVSTTSDFGLFRLLWWGGKSDSYCMAEGECSRKAFKRRCDAIAYGARHYGETAKPVPRNFT